MLLPPWLAPWRRSREEITAWWSGHLQHGPTWQLTLLEVKMDGVVQRVKKNFWMALKNFWTFRWCTFGFVSNNPTWWNTWTLQIPFADRSSYSARLSPISCQEWLCSSTPFLLCRKHAASKSTWCQRLTLWSLLCLHIAIQMFRCLWNPLNCTCDCSLGTSCIMLILEVDLCCFNLHCFSKFIKHVKLKI